MLDELRHKSPYKKELYAFWGALGITALIATGWAFSLPIRFSDLDKALEGEAANQTAGGLNEFFSNVKEEAADAFGATASSSPAADSSWGLGVFATSSNTTSDPIIIATSSKPVVASSSILIGTSSAPR